MAPKTQRRKRSDSAQEDYDDGFGGDAADVRYSEINDQTPWNQYKGVDFPDLDVFIAKAQDMRQLGYGIAMIYMTGEEADALAANPKLAALPEHEAFKDWPAPVRVVQGEHCIDLAKRQAGNPAHAYIALVWERPEVILPVSMRAAAAATKKPVKKRPPSKAAAADAEDGPVTEKAPSKAKAKLKKTSSKKPAGKTSPAKAKPAKTVPTKIGPAKVGSAKTASRGSKPSPAAATPSAPLATGNTSTSQKSAKAKVTASPVSPKKKASSPAAKTKKAALKPD